jgi:hypothetical protein
VRFQQFFDHFQHLGWALSAVPGEIKKCAQGWAFLSTLKLPDVIAMIAGAMGKRILRVTAFLPQPTQNNTEGTFGVKRSLAAAKFSRHGLTVWP